MLTQWTIPNVACNLPTTDEARATAHSRASFYSGDWASLATVMRPPGSAGYDVVLMAETVYEPKSYGALCALLPQLLSGPGSVVYLASKTYYFGVGM